MRSVDHNWTPVDESIPSYVRLRVMGPHDLHYTFAKPSRAANLPTNPEDVYLATEESDPFVIRDLKKQGIQLYIRCAVPDEHTLIDLRLMEGQ
jgi:hypothetical protein